MNAQRNLKPDQLVLNLFVLVGGVPGGYNTANPMMQLIPDFPIGQVEAPHQVAKRGFKVDEGASSLRQNGLV